MATTLTLAVGRQVLQRGSADEGALVLLPRNPDHGALLVSATVSLSPRSTPGGRRELDAAVAFAPTIPAPADVQCAEAQAVLGVVTLGDGRWPVPFVVLVTAMSRVTDILGSPCYKVTDTALLQLGGRRLLAHASAQQRSKLESDATAVRLFLNTAGLYVAPGADLSRPLQAAREAAEEAGEAQDGEFPWQFAWADFWFNFHLSREMRQCEAAHGWVVVAIQGFVGEAQLEAVPAEGSAGEGEEGSVTLALISRRQWRRGGTRYHHRGIDDHGNVANHIETEQLLRTADGLSSWVQIRGSAPVHFMQRHAGKCSRSLCGLLAKSQRRGLYSGQNQANTNSHEAPRGDA